jgi:hypothetical protein
MALVGALIHPIKQLMGLLLHLADEGLSIGVKPGNESLRALRRAVDERLSIGVKLGNESLRALLRAVKASVGVSSYLPDQAAGCAAVEDTRDRDGKAHDGRCTC